MLRVEQVRRVRDLLAEGELSQRAIALQCGISRASVANIAQDQRPLELLFPLETSPEPRRCGQCGAMVVMPCRGCAARQHQRHVLAMRRWTMHQTGQNHPPRRPAA